MFLGVRCRYAIDSIWVGSVLGDLTRSVCDGMWRQALLSSLRVGSWEDYCIELKPAVYLNCTPPVINRSTWK